MGTLKIAWRRLSDKLSQYLLSDYERKLLAFYSGKKFILGVTDERIQSALLRVLPALKATIVSGKDAMDPEYWYLYGGRRDIDDAVIYLCLGYCGKGVNFFTELRYYQPSSDPWRVAIAISQMKPMSAIAFS
jgi:hypothetical protein